MTPAAAFIITVLAIALVLFLGLLIAWGFMVIAERRDAAAHRRAIDEMWGDL